MTKDKILCVDDDEIIRYSFQKDLGRRFSITVAESGAEALALIEKEGPFAVIVADMLMPEMNGVELLAQAQRVAPDTVRIMLTGDEEKQTAIEAINEGRIFRFFSKPCPPPTLIAAIDAGIEQYRLVTAERELLEQTLNGSVKMLTELLSVAEPGAFGRGQKLREYVQQLAPSLGFEHTWDIEVAAMLAQIGLMSIPPVVMQKLNVGLALTDREKEMIARIPEIGFNVLSKILRLEPAAQIILYQNKHADGSGFPKYFPETGGVPKGSKLLKILADLINLETRGVAKRNAFDQMRTGKGVYDENLLDRVIAAFVSHERPTNANTVQLKELRAGDELLCPIETLDGRLIAPAGTYVSPMMLERFHNFAELSGIKEPIFVKNQGLRL